MRFKVQYFIDGVSNKAYFRIYLLDGLSIWKTFTVDKDDFDVYGSIANGFEDCLNQLVNT